ncbi:TlyA family RNA methyltransferase [Mesomycoplasma lagogenitalium]|uniref:TlyA family RNA methyltransferase n=1 Tax=Mesomycoplasma lagogenitalium TaxID=171286 RepID=A0ABY8LSP8_9BACT|nr:TlyA family RNA methyltransferase [Mesomycoplasma lagogenitalium]WGI36275.1 TlyA family RNA methyltransferase [Mesomycoplasma lagogenitalium]
MKKKLLDLVNEKGYENGETLIRIGKVLVNDQIILLPHLKVDINSVITVKQTKKEWVSRGAYKLLKAIEIFNLDFENKTVLDIGSSTGGFTQVALKNGAKKVYALDVGTNQLEYSLRNNLKVIVMEKTNLKSINFKKFNEIMDIIVCDVSFISLKEVFKVINEITDYNTQIMLLIKPQFEASSKYVEQGGYVNPKHHPFLINRVSQYALEYSFKLINVHQSPITGNKSKNIEYLSLYERIKDEEKLS